jgi:hypothetical protein
VGSGWLADGVMFTIDDIDGGRGRGGGGGIDWNVGSETEWPILGACAGTWPC